MQVDTKSSTNNELLGNVIDMMLNLRMEAKAKKDFATSDKIRNQLMEMGIQLKDEKDGEVSFTFS